MASTPVASVNVQFLVPSVFFQTPAVSDHSPPARENEAPTVVARVVVSTNVHDPDSTVTVEVSMANAPFRVNAPVPRICVEPPSVTTKPNPAPSARTRVPAPTVVLPV